MSDEEVNEAFARVLADAQAADEEQYEEFAQFTQDRMSFLLDVGLAPVYVQEINGRKCVAIPVEIMSSLLGAINDYCEFNSEVARQTEMGNAAVLLGAMISDLEVQALAVKSAFIALAMYRDSEQEEGEE